MAQTPDGYAVTQIPVTERNLAGLDGQPTPSSSLRLA